MLVVDIIIVVLLVIMAVRGFSKGFIMQLAGLLAIGGGIIASYFFWNKVYILFKEWFTLDHYALKAISVVSTIIIIAALILLIGKLISKTIHITPLGLIDNLFGLLFGIGQMVLFLSFTIFALLSINPHISFLQQEHLSQSYLLPYIQPIASSIISYFF